MTTEQKIGTPVANEDTYLKSLSENKEEKEEYEKYLAALDDYYKLKDEYEGVNSNYHKKKIQIRKDKSLSKSEKYSELQKIKENRPCVNCSQKGGTLFATEQATKAGFQVQQALIARCNVKDKKCDLNIEIIPRRIKYINNIDKDIIHNIKKTKQKIISSKLSLLFDLQPEDVVLKEFDDLKDDLDKYNSQLKIIEEKLGDNNSIKILDPNSGEPKTITKKEYLKNKNRKLSDAIYEFKNRILKIDDTNSNTIRNAFDTYSDISNVQQEINDVTYEEYFVDYIPDGKPGPSKENPYYIIKNENSIQQMEITSGEYAIVKNEK